MATRVVTARRNVERELRLSNRALRTHELPINFLMEEAVNNPGIISLAAGLVDSESLPRLPIARITAALLADPDRGASALQYGTTAGARELRERLAQYLEQLDVAAGRDLELTPDQIVVTSGSQQFLFLLGDVLLNPHDIVLVGEPDYFVYLGVLQCLGAEPIGVAVDADGMIPDALDDALRQLERDGELHRAKLVYCTSYSQNPTGVTLSLERRSAVLELARYWSKHGTLFVLEDAAYRELTFSEPPLPSMRSFDESGETVILAQSFSKSFSPGLRAGYAVVPDSLRPHVLRQKGSHDFGSSNFVQHVLAAAMAAGEYSRHVMQLRDTYRHKLDVMLHALEDSFGALRGLVEWIRPDGGLYVWLKLPESVDTRGGGSLFRRCLDHGVLYVPGEYCFAARRADVVGATMGLPSHTARLSFGVLPPDRLREGVARLAAAVAAELSIS